MNIENKDCFFAPKTPSGYEPSFEKIIEVAGRGIKKHRNALIELAKQ
ncbi:hypothetical protein [Synechocystis sp. PCC 7509]|nr:hypothetical protein [Synechocystis sp. PCC 7509]